MADNSFLTPILKRTDRFVGNSPISKRRSVTFRDDDQTSSSNVETSPKESSSKQSPDNLNNVPSFSRGSKIQLTDFGLCYTPGNEPTLHLDLPREAIHQQTAKIISKEHCLRPELLRSSRVDQYNIVMFGDAIHGKCLKKQLEDYPEIRFKMSLFAFPTKANIRMADFILILLPLEVIGSCSKAGTILQRVLSLRADGSMRCAAVGVSSSSGSDQHVIELLNIHTLLLQYSLSYYIWSDASPGSWPGIVRRLATEVVSCGEGRGALPRPALCSLLWPSDSPSFMLQQYLDQTAHRRGLDLNYE